MTQLSLPADISITEIARKSSLGKAITYCYEAADLEPKQLLAKIGGDKGQLSRWESGTEGVIWPKLSALMDACGNDAPLLWMNHARGWDLNAMRRRESELEQDLRLAREEVAALKRVLMSGGVR